MLTRPQPPLPKGLAPAKPIVFRAIARGLKPRPRRTTAEWAAAERYVSAESGSPFPGKWSNDLTPHLVEPMECCTLSHPARSVVFKKCHQAGWSEAGLNLIGSIIVDDPAPIVVVLPTIDDMKKYVKIKLQPMIDGTPTVAAKVREQKSRDEDGSTTTFKKFQGGYLQLTGANASSGLKMITGRVAILEEVTEYTADVDNQGDPVELIKKRLTTWEGYEKIIYISTPGEKGSCRISAAYELSDQRVLYLPCPQCGVYQPLKWERFDKDAVEPTYACAAHGCVIIHMSLRSMLRAAAWIKTYPGDEANPKPPETIEPAEITTWRNRTSAGREPGFFFPAYNSPLMSWAAIVRTWREAKGTVAKEKDFVRQVLAEAWEDKGEAPDHEKLFEKRVPYEWRRVPKGALFLTGACDVQGNRLEWAVYAWGPAFTSWLIDKGVIEGDPEKAETWKPLDEVLFERSWADAFGRPWKLDAFGVDSGAYTQCVYRYVRHRASWGKLFALDGRKGWRLPAIGTATKQDVDYQGKKIGTIMLFPVGGWDLKSELYSALRKMVKGRDADGHYETGTAFYGDACDLTFFEQLTAEQLVLRKGRYGLEEQAWKVTLGKRNEQHDLAVYARALAHHIGDSMSPEQWAALAADRGAKPEDVQRDMAALWSTPAVPPLPGPPAPPERPQADNQDNNWLGDRAKNWLN